MARTNTSTLRTKYKDGLEIATKIIIIPRVKHGSLMIHSAPFYFATVGMQMERGVINTNVTHLNVEWHLSDAYLWRFSYVYPGRIS